VKSLRVDDRLDLVSHPSILTLEVDNHFYITNVYHDTSDPSRLHTLLDLEQSNLNSTHELEDWAPLNLLNTLSTSTRFGEGSPDRRQRVITIDLAHGSYP